MNTGPRVQYQFICNLVNTCGACLQYHMAIGSWWPLPFHSHCRCTQVSVRPGGTAPHAFADFRQVLDEMPHSQQVKAIGASNYKLLQAKIVSWEEVVTRYRVRTFREVIALNKVSAATALKAGVRPGVVKTAYAAVARGPVAAAVALPHAPPTATSATPAGTTKSISFPFRPGAAAPVGPPPVIVPAPPVLSVVEGPLTAPNAADLIRAHRAELIEQIRGAGVSQEALVDALSRGLTGRVTIVGPGGTQSMAPFVQRRQGDLLAAELAAMTTAAAAAAVVQPARVVVGEDSVRVTRGGRVTVVRPGETAFGKTYEELRAMKSGRHDL